MGFNRNDVARVKREYSEKYRLAQSASEDRKIELWGEITGLRELDRELSMTGLRIMAATMEKGADTRALIEKIKENNERLLVERAALLRAYGYPEDYTDVHYECEACGDTGYVDTKMCDCMKRALVLAGYESSGLGELIKTQSFENFSLDWYKNSAEIYSKMNMNFNKIKNYAENFSKDTYYNMLFMGTTGLGKTHLSTALAKTVIDKHFDVLYVTATGMMGDFEQKRFGNSAIEGDVGDTDRYYSADLLIIDDLGTEIANQFTTTCLYDVINARIIKRKSTIISTNLKMDEIRKRYWDRITSRIFGEYQPVSFVGTDIRQQKVVLGRTNKN